MSKPHARLPQSRPLGAVVCFLFALLIAALPAGAAAHSPAAEPSCSTFLSTGAVSTITGVKAAPYGHPVKYLASNGIPDGTTNETPGSACEWTNSQETETGLQNAANLVVGYGETAKGWKKLVNYFKQGAPTTGWPIGISSSPTYKPLSLGHGSKSFLTTVDLASYYGYAEGEAGLPTNLYTITVLTARHNLLQVWFNPATRDATEAWVENVLVKDAKFF